MPSLDKELLKLSKEILETRPFFDGKLKQNSISKINTVCRSLPYHVVIAKLPSAIPVYFCPKTVAFLQLGDLNESISDFKIYNKIIHSSNTYLITEGMTHFLKNKKANFSFSLKARKQKKEWVWIYGRSTLMRLNGKKYTITIAKELSELINIKDDFKNESLEEEIANLLLTSKREREVLIMIVREQSVQKIAEKLNLSVHTVQTHRKNIRKKLKIKSTIGLIKYGLLLEKIPLSFFEK